MQAENINILWSYLIVEELIRNGIDYFCISPGSRSAPLTTVVARHSNAQKKLFYDERAAAFHALGYARSAHKPAVLICTSGTAAANYYPAVIEAFNERIPLIILSADRPPELLDTQANQTIKQHNLYGQYAKWHNTMPTPSENIKPQMVLTTIDLMISKSMGDSKGPVHLNCMFREPLEPKKEKIKDSYLSLIERWQKSRKPFTKYYTSPIIADKNIIKEVNGILEKSKRGLLIIGRLSKEINVSGLINRLRWPVFADITSGCRFIKSPYMIQNFDHLMLNSDFLLDTILHIGAQFTSKRLLQLTSKVNPENYILIEDSSERIDPHHTVTLRIHSDVNPFIKRLSQTLSIKKTEKGWIEDILNKDKQISGIIDDQMSRDTLLSEPVIARLISENIFSQNGLFLSNSMPIRDMNTFAVVNDAFRFVGANRGASGIDGIIASASGFAAGLQRTTILLIGDLAFLHDINSLHLLKNSSLPLIIVLLNNNGGGIFRFLPIAKYEEIFKPYFLTPHTFTFQYAAKLFEIPYHLVENKSTFVEIFTEAQNQNKTIIIEAKTDSVNNYRFHIQLNQIVQERVK